MRLPEDYVSVKFFQFAGAPTKNKYAGTYQGSCPMCQEGASWLKKKRFFYIPLKNNIYCHNCGYSKDPVNWIMDMTKMTYRELMNDVENYAPEFSYSSFNNSKIEKEESPTLPDDSINLFDSAQVEYYLNSNKSHVKDAIEYLKNRKIDIAINKPKAIFFSNTDRVHRNRIILPFYDSDGKIIHYQSRSFLEGDICPKYLSKVHSDKSLFNINNVDPSYPYIFIFEGPINACFVENGVAVAGIQEKSLKSFNSKQENQLKEFPLQDRIWVLDSQWIDSASLSKTEILLNMGETVFIWPKKIGKTFKDFNDITIKMNSNKISPDWILKHQYRGEKGLERLRYIKRLLA